MSSCSRSGILLLAFLFLVLPSLAACGNDDEDSGNYGTLDIVKALEWIQDNIEAFGGDPKCILFNADSDEAHIAMSTIELTKSGVLEAMRSEVPEPMYSEALEYFSSFIMVSYLLEEDKY